MNSTMDKVPVERVQKFYENKGFTLTTNDESGDTHMEKNCSFTAKYFISDKGGNEATEPTWRTSPSGKEYCLLMGIAKVKKLPTVSTEPKLCILNKASYDNGDFELDTMYSSIANIPMTNEEGYKLEDFNDIYFTVFENEATNNDMGDLMNDEWAAFMADEDLED